MSAISNAGLKELSKAYQAFAYIALDGSDTTYDVSQTAPISELSLNGAARKLGTATHDSGTGTVTISTQFTFTGEAAVRAVCFLNAASGGVMLSRYVPASGTLPSVFGNQGSLLIEATATLSRPA